MTKKVTINLSVSVKSVRCGTLCVWTTEIQSLPVTFAFMDLF
jgi:hypothetical protein